MSAAKSGAYRIAYLYRRKFTAGESSALSTTDHCGHPSSRSSSSQSMSSRVSGGVISFVFMFIFAHLPQLVNGPLAAFSTVSSLWARAPQFLPSCGRPFLVKDALDDMFDGTLVTRNNKTAAVSCLARAGSRKVAAIRLPSWGSCSSCLFRLKSIRRRIFIGYVMYPPFIFIPGCLLLFQFPSHPYSHWLKPCSWGNRDSFPMSRKRWLCVSSRPCYLTVTRIASIDSPAIVFQLKKWSNSRIQAWLEENVGPYIS